MLAGAVQGGCEPDPKKAPTKPPPALAAAPCLRTRPTDLPANDGINTRTGCVVITKPLGSVTGAADLSLPVALIRNEGIAPPKELYPTAWFGLGEWLSIDEYITKEAEGVYTLHTPLGDNVYDFQVMVPYAGLNVDPNDSKVTLFAAYRTRPFDGTFLIPITYGYRLVVGNTFDTRSLTKWYGPETLPGAAKGTEPRLLRRLTKASIYKGPENEISISRNYDDKNGLSVSFSSTLYGNKPPLRIESGLARSDGQEGFETSAVMLLMHGWKQTSLAAADAAGNVVSFVTSGRSDAESQRTTFAYDHEDQPTKTVLRQLHEQEGTAADLRTLRKLELTKRAAANGAKPFAIQEMVDRTLPGAEQTHVVSECPRRAQDHPGMPTYLTFNSATGTSAAFEYADDSVKNQLVRTVDDSNHSTRIIYNPAGGGLTNDQKGRIPATAFETKNVTLESSEPGSKALSYTHRFDKFSLDKYKIPLVGKIAIEKADRSGPAIYRAVYGDYFDEVASRNSRTFDVPYAVAGEDGRLRWEYRGLDGFVYETWDESQVETRYRLAQGAKDTEVIETSVMGSKRARATRDRFGRVLETVHFEPSVGAAEQPTTTMRLTADGFTDRIDDTGTGERIELLGWNTTRSVITEAKVTRNGKLVSAFKTKADAFGNADGEGTMTFGSVTLATTTARFGAGLFRSATLTGPDGRKLTSEIAYPDGQVIPSKETLNGQVTNAGKPKPATAKDGCK